MSATRKLATPDGETLALREWLPPAPLGAVMVIAHGLGEHAGRYAHVARRLGASGISVRAYDHFGHGESTGARGGLPHPMRLVDDLALVLDDTRRAYPDVPLVLLGHSMGGLVAASLVARGVRPVDALVLSSPALAPTLTSIQKGLIAVLSRLAPTLRVGNGLDARFLSHDPAVVKAYQDDPLNHDRIGARLARFLADEGEFVQSVASRWTVPTLLVYAGQDRLVRPEGSRRFAAAAPPAVVRSVEYDALFHEIFNEVDAEPVYAELESWLQGRFKTESPAIKAAVTSA